MAVMSGLASIHKTLKTVVDIDKHPVDEATRLMGNLKCYSESNELNREVEQWMHSELSRLIEAHKLHKELAGLASFDIDTFLKADEVTLHPAHFDPTTGVMVITTTEDMKKLNEQAKQAQLP